ncbi:MAG: sigma 54-interacting transcriptional regulator [Deltaproteobacteria bacterium]|jgi:DNA-binding NtrC family response regulator|nr:sigma 54-interacting transcriptional regulator [Deltaproteobacteria bacterium]
MREARFLVGKVASRRAKELLVGERNVKKEEVARYIHSAGLPAGVPFVKYGCTKAASGETATLVFWLSCAVDPPTSCHSWTAYGEPSTEGTCFAQCEASFLDAGAAKGAEGADDRRSLAEAATGGRLFLDSVELPPLPAQAALLQALKDRPFETEPGKSPVTEEP